MTTLQRSGIPALPAAPIHLAAIHPEFSRLVLKAEVI